MICIMLFWAFLGLIHCFQCTEASRYILPGEVSIDGRTLVRCEDIPRGATLEGGMVSIGDDISCSGSPKIIRVNAGTSVIRSVGNRDMFVENVVWLIESGAHVIFTGRTVTIAMDKEMEVISEPLINTYGVVDFKVSGWHASFDEAETVDNYGLLRKNRLGEVRPEKNLRYTRRSIVAAASIGSSPPDVSQGAANRSNKPPLPDLPRRKAVDRHLRTPPDNNPAPQTGNVAPAVTEIANPQRHKIDRQYTATSSDDDAAIKHQPAMNVKGVGDTTRGGSSDPGATAAGVAAPRAPSSRDDLFAAVFATLSGLHETDGTDDAGEESTASPPYRDSSSTAVADDTSSPSKILAEQRFFRMIKEERISAERDKRSHASTVTSDRRSPMRTSGGPFPNDGSREQGIQWKTLGIPGRTLPTMSPTPRRHTVGSAANKSWQGYGSEASLMNALNSGFKDVGAEVERLFQGRPSSESIEDQLNRGMQNVGAETNPRFHGSGGGDGGKKNRFNGSYGSNDSGNGGSDVFSAASMPTHPRSTFSAKDPLRGKIFNEDGTAMVYASNVDMIVMHAKTAGAAKGKGGPLAGSPEMPRVLLVPDRKKMAEVWRIREEIRDEIRKDEERQARGEKKGVLASAMGWLPGWGGGFRHRRRIEHAKAHLGETEVVVTDRGRLEGSVDGTVVLRKSGPSFFGYRRKDPTYRGQVTENGLEILRKGKHDWGVQLLESEFGQPEVD